MKWYENEWNDRFEYVIDDSGMNEIHLCNSKHIVLDVNNFYDQTILLLFSSLFILIYIFCIDNNWLFTKMKVNEKAWN